MARLILALSKQWSITLTVPRCLKNTPLLPRISLSELNPFLTLGEKDVFGFDGECFEALVHEILHSFFVVEWNDFVLVDHGPFSCFAQYIYFVEDDVRDAVHAYGAFERLHIHPVDLAAAAGRCAKFFTNVTDCVENLAFVLKLFASDIRFVNFCDTPHVVHGIWRQSIQKCAGRCAMGRGYKRVIAPVDIESETLRALCEYIDVGQPLDSALIRV